jgi:membrane protein
VGARRPYDSRSVPSLPDRLKRFERHIVAVLRFLRACFHRAIEIEFVDRSVALASLAFTAVIPLGVVTGSLLPSVGRRNFADSIVQRFELHDEPAALVRDLFAPPEDVRSAASLLSVILLVISVLSFTRGLQRVYERCWRLPARGVRGTPAGLLWVLEIVLFIAVFAGVRRWLIELGGDFTATVVALSFSFVIWLVTPRTLLGGRIDWYPLIPTAAVSAVAMTGLSIGSVLYMPGAIAESADRYGEIGVAIAMVSWLVAAGFALVGSAAIGAVIAERRGMWIPPPTDAP